MTRYFQFVLVLIFLIGYSCGEVPDSNDATEVGDRPYIVFVTGDEEYRSEESMRMLADIAARELDVRVRVCYAVDSAGIIDPNRNDHIEGLAALDSADLMVLFTRWRNLPKSESDHITRYAESGKPMVGFRTTTHAFLIKEDSSRFHLNNEWPTEVFGQQWITHHGHFDDGAYPLSSLSFVEDNTNHPILTGVDTFPAYSWLYHVDGGDWSLTDQATRLIRGHSLKSKHEMDGKLDEFPKTQPVAWTKTYTGSAGTPARVFFTTLGHPYDFKEESMRRLALNGMLWAMEREEQITPDLDVTPSFPYAPNNSGFGERFKQGVSPRRY